MNKTEKVNYLYQIAMGEPVTLTPQQKNELRPYKMRYVGKPYTTKGNISQYISAVDGGDHSDFYNWCMNNAKGDRRTKQGKKGTMRELNMRQNFGIMLIGCLFWGVMISEVAGDFISQKVTAILGMGIALVLYKWKRQIAGLTLILLPIILGTIFYPLFH